MTSRPTLTTSDEAQVNNVTGYGLTSYGCYSKVMARSYIGHSKVKSDEGTDYLCCDNVVVIIPTGH